MKTLLISITSITALLLASCSSTPTGRIKKNPQIFSSLSKEHQTLAQQGQISEGMTKNAVFIAKGHADRELTQLKNKKRTDRWDYSVLTPVFHTGFNSYYNSGYRRGYGRHRNGHWGLGYSPSVTYIPSLGSSIYFENDKVSGFSTVQR